MDDTRQIEAVENWCARNAEWYRVSGLEDAAHALRRIVEVWISDHRRKTDNRVGTLAELWELKTAIRLAGLLLSAVQETQPEQMQGWRYQCKPSNEFQAYYTELYRLSLQLGFSIVEIEDEHPEHAAVFEAERRDYTRYCEELNEQFQD